ncbi:MAG: DUF418 domain-containing protein [Desulfobacteraceae bacterium]|uniref:DUF418 domain-containing protein n=1 Tax=Candidatus Desulfacyla euxinica TaxID=2841693 RepID=A0A8J6N0J3_9DELT|nr:DUF418 domain-containing protein [Candidatus Desulfacyla euxinica]MBL6977362.1 DUF418 domain-containing protein [Desulfobacteraceae bacterium]
MKEISSTHISNSKVSAPMASNRISGYDLARALAFFGMLIINYWVLMEDYNPFPPWVAFVLDSIQGRAAATFVVLAGIGLSLLSRRAYLNRDAVSMRIIRHRMWRRAIFLFVIGGLNSMIWGADILHFYAIYFAAGAVFLNFSNQRLFVLATISVTIFSLLMFIFDFDLGWERGSISYEDWPNMPRLAGHLFFNGHYPFFPWVAFMVLGLWLGRQDLTDNAMRNAILLAGIGAMFFSEFISWLALNIRSFDSSDLYLDAVLPWFYIDPWEPMPLFLISAGGTALVVIGYCMVLTEKLGNAQWISPFIAVGQSTLTLYVAHTLIGSILLKGMELCKIEPYFFPIWGAILFFISALLISSLWKKHLHRGPLEWLMRGFLNFTLPLKAKTV